MESPRSVVTPNQQTHNSAAAALGILGVRSLTDVPWTSRGRSRRGASPSAACVSGGERKAEGVLCCDDIIPGWTLVEAFGLTSGDILRLQDSSGLQVIEREQ